MIQHFKDKKTEATFNGERVREFDGIRRQAQKALNLLDSVSTLYALRTFRRAHLETLKGDREGLFSIRINDQWRVCFEWHADGPRQVEITDYH